MKLRSDFLLWLVGSMLLVFLWPTKALAHTQGSEATGLFSGLRHPVSGLDHVLAMVAVDCGEPNSDGRRYGCCR